MKLNQRKHACEDAGAAVGHFFSVPCISRYGFLTFNITFHTWAQQFGFFKLRCAVADGFLRLRNEPCQRPFQQRSLRFNIVSVIGVVTVSMIIMQWRSSSPWCACTQSWGPRLGRSLHYTTAHNSTLHYTTLHYTTLHYTTLPYTTPVSLSAESPTESTPAPRL